MQNAHADKLRLSPAYDRFERLVLDMPSRCVLRITLGGPGRLNTVDAKMHAELAEIWRVVDADENVSAVLLRGDGKGFSAGGDFASVQSGIDDFNARARMWKETRDIVYNILHCSKPIVSAMHGVAVGAGLVCGLLSDISIAAHDARLIDGHTRLGVVAGDNAAMVWPLLCGMAKAKHYLLLCDPISGQEAERIGLVSMSVPAEELQDTAMKITERLAAGAPNAIRLTKHALNGWFRMAMPIFDASCAMEFLTISSPDVVEGLTSHREKRKPAFDPYSPL